MLAIEHQWGAALPAVRIRSRAPLRLGLAGGGTDVSPYTNTFGGAVLNATIDRHAFVFIEPAPDWRIRFIAADIGIEEDLPLDMNALVNAKLQIHAAVYRRMINEFGRGRPLAITVKSSVDAPPGSGLGSSSALVVALVEAFRAVLDVPIGAYEVARLAYEVERIELGISGGKQDQYAAAFGGINFIEFMVDDRVIVNPLRIGRAAQRELEASLITCFSGISRRSADIISEQQKGMTDRSTKTIDSFHQLKTDAVDMKVAFLRGHIDEMATVLNRSWSAKKITASGISTAEIDRLYDIAISQGALAGKVSGAGGGGFIMFIAPPERRLSVIAALNEAGGQAEGVHLTLDGAESWISPNKT